jgi:predicted transcriptional regulator
MHAKQLSNHVESIGARVSTDTLCRIDECATAANQSRGTWIRNCIEREVLRREIDNEEVLAVLTAQNRTLMAELIALRTILLTMAREKSRNPKFGADDMDAVLQMADGKKFEMADARLTAGRAA